MSPLLTQILIYYNTFIFEEKQLKTFKQPHLVTSRFIKVFYETATCHDNHC